MQDPTPYRCTPRFGAADHLDETVGFADLEAVFADVPDTLTGYHSEHTHNLVRAGFALAALRAYAQCTGAYDQSSTGTALSDLCGDLGHLCDVLGLDWDQLVEAGRYHYDHEIRHCD
ncbi:hypothetical protein BJF87_22390 [Gordonia sp. CNJ-863]|nr:hypothetical protein BJF87_22390 [Gordonia sp. CNJ-863]